MGDRVVDDRPSQCVTHLLRRPSGLLLPAGPLLLGRPHRGGSSARGQNQHRKGCDEGVPDCGDGRVFMQDAETAALGWARKGTGVRSSCLTELVRVIGAAELRGKHLQGAGRPCASRRPLSGHCRLLLGCHLALKNERAHCTQPRSWPGRHERPLPGARGLRPRSGCSATTASDPEA